MRASSCIWSAVSFVGAQRAEQFAVVRAVTGSEGSPGFFSK
jgi:hypothetical protein